MSGWVIVQGVILRVGNCPTLGADILHFVILLCWFYT